MSDDSNPPKRPRPLTRRDFLIRSNAGAAAVGVMTGAGFAALAGAAEAAQAGKPARALQSVGNTSRRVTLDLDGRKQDVTVDVRDSLWETLNYQLGLSNCNQGCDRAQCGACAVVVDGNAVNGCSILTARLGRGQKILTVAGITRGPGIGGLHPVQRAFWFEGGFQCGICTRGFVMSTYALLEANNNPTDDEIKEALSGNICRCGEYAGIMRAVRTAAAEMRGEKIRYTTSLGTETTTERSADGVKGVSKEFVFVTALGTIEQFEELSMELKQVPGILGVAGSERTITPTWDPAVLDEAKVRQLLAQSGHAVK